MSLLAFNMNHHLHCIYLFLFFLGCLAPDPGQNISTTSISSTQKQAPQTRAPLKIDPAILQNRTFNEAPMFTEQVNQGKLPPVSDRLPENPLVIVPLEEIGTYGGTLRRALTGDIVQTPGPNKTLNENLMGYERPFPNSIQYNLCEHFTYEDSGKVAIFKIRKGVKWSDGHPFTVDDILFWYYDMTFDDDARQNPFPPAGWMVDGKPMRLKKIDPHTLEISSPKPLGRVLHELSRALIAAPKHVLSPLHPKYNPKTDYNAFREATTSAQLLMQPGIPRISAWIPVEWIRGQRIIYERNPYYWKIDTAGNQLPYADRIIFNVIQDPQVILLKFINGELDLIGRYTRIDMFPTLKVKEKTGKFNLRITGPNRGPAYHLNWDAPNPALREAFRNKNVRIALSHAINREEIDEIVFHGLLDPSGYSFGPISPYFSPEAYKKYAEYDPDKARHLLELEGYIDTDGDGIRELRNGSRFELTIDFVHPGGMFNGQPVSELVADHWRAVGIKVNLNGSLRDIIVPRRYNCEYDVHYWGLEGPNAPLTYPIGWAILAKNVPYWHQKAWDEGPPWLREATQYVRLAMTTVDTAKLRTYMTRVRDLHTENVPIITIGSAYHVWGASSRLGNIPYENVADNAFLGWSRPVFHEQIFVKK
ncbi:MAG: ABC transporter substrate-binding protein [Gemmatimonadota bacterium]|nr:ABC transporter substrate-binding protein [Gemmatimonadota bacterium]